MHVVDGDDWAPWFRAAAVNGAWPAAAAATAAVALACRPRAAAPPAGNTADRVVATENAVLFREASRVAHEAEAAARSSPPHTATRNAADLVAALAFVALHAAGAALEPEHEWQRRWLLYWAFAAGATALAARRGARLCGIKLTLLAAYAAAALSNMRTAWLLGGRCALSTAEAALALALLLVALALPTHRTLPPRVHTLYTASAASPGAAFADLPPSGPPAPLAPLDERASLLSRLTFMFMTPFVWRQYWQRTTIDTVPEVPHMLRAPIIVALERARGAVDTPLLRRLWHVLGPTASKQLALSMLRACVRSGPILCLSQLLAFVSARDAAKARGDATHPPLYMGFFWAAGMLACQILDFMLEIHVFQHGRVCGVHLRSFLTTELLSKVTRRRLHYAAGAPVAAPADGHVASLLSVDIFKTDSFLAFLHQPLADYPLTILVCVVLLVRHLGVAALAGLSILVVTAPLQTRLSRAMVRVQERILRATDARLNLASEIFASIKTVKFFAWEPAVLAHMQETRRAELDVLARNNAFSMLYNFVFVGMPMVVTLVSFAVYTLVLGRPLTAQTAFTSLTIFTTLRMPLADLPEMIVSMLSALVSMRRIDAFLQTDDTQKYVQLGEAQQPMDIGFERASFAYYGDTRPTLIGIDTRFPAGQLSLVLGPVGAGKTSLLLALLGELQSIEGRARLPAPVARSLVRTDPATGLTESAAYCAQAAWLLGTTIRENILFGSAYDETRYRDVLRACALEPDLDLLEFHDETEVGEKGTALSGGQKARIALARAFYSRARHVLIDDALSAVDAHTAQHLYEHCLRGPLAAGRTIVLVTHAVALTLPGAAHAVVMHSGRIAAQGHPNELAAAGQLGARLAAPPNTQPPQSPRRDADKHWARAKERRTRKDRSANAESVQRRAKSSALYSAYVFAVARRRVLAVVLWVALLALYASVRATDISATSWLRMWANSYERTGAEASDRTPHYLRYYAVLVVLFVVLTTLRDGTQYFLALRASRRLYDRLLRTLLHACPRFFDTTPIGRIMNRLSKDVETVDLEITTSLRMLTEAAIGLVTIIGVICWATPRFLYVAAFILLLYYLIGQLYLGSSRDLKRIESVERSPLFTLLGETLLGTVTIRAYSDAERVLRRGLYLIDRTNRAFLYLWLENRWLSICVNTLGSLVTFTTVCLLLARDAEASLVGFTLSYSVMIVQTVLRIVRRYTVTEINMNSVERIEEYAHVPVERAAGAEPPAHWPSDRGVIQIRDLSVRYAPEFPLALDGVSFDVQPGEKIGIVGRTGSGKSTLSLAFFRFLEAERGSITIDGIDIASIALATLRQRLTIIPQDAQLFGGTIRSNLDPFGVYDDGDMWFALKRCRLAISGDCPGSTAPHSPVQSLDDIVEQNGANLSAGQRQLLALARGLLKMRDSRLLLLDESTANLDTESDAFIQRTLREQMSPGTTLLTVAHRLRTIIDYDRVLVLSHGHVVEYDTPATLLSRKDTAFYQLCAQSGELDVLIEAATAAAHRACCT